jgi:transcription-repair coupling factor (superfamily II helicase)
VSPLLSYLDEDWTLILEGDLSLGIREFWNDSTSRYKLLRGDAERPLLDPSKLFLSEEKFLS